jgi:hypothetical protein
MGFGRTLTVDIGLMNMRAALKGAVGYNIYFKKEKQNKERKTEMDGLQNYMTLAVHSP